MKQYDKVFDTIEKINNQAHPDGISNTIMDYISQFGLDSYCIAGLPDPNEHNHTDFILLNNWPDEWLNLYTQNEYVFTDPVIRDIRIRTDPLIWTRDNFLEINSGAETVLNEGAEFGLRSGCTIPIFSTHGFQSCMTFCSTSKKLEMPPRSAAALHLLAIYAHGKLANILSGNDRKTTEKPQLSNRELECLKWASAGKTSWEIGEILGISNRTVETYFASVRKKMDTYSTIQSVAEAMRTHLLN